MTRGEENANPYESPRCERAILKRQRIDVTKPLSPLAVLVVSVAGTFGALAVPFFTFDAVRPQTALLGSAAGAVLFGTLMLGLSVLIKIFGRV